MIFVTLGSQKFQFNRLLKEIDSLVKKGVITEEVFAQSGYSDYAPKHYDYKQFLSREEFAQWEAKADTIITHGGTGAIIGAVKKRKKVIAVPRLAQYGEHVDDHQLQLIEQFKEQNLICGLSDVTELENGLEYIKTHTFAVYESNTQTIIDAIEDALESWGLVDSDGVAPVRVLMCGSDRSVKGGMTSVINQLMEHDWGENLQLSYLATHINGNPIKKVLFFEKGYLKLNRLLNKNAFDVIHIHMSYKGSFYRKYRVAKLCKKYNKKVIIHLHGSEFKDFYHNGSAKRKQKITELFSMVDTTIVLGEDWKLFIQTIAPQAQVRVVNNAVTIPAFVPKEVRSVRTLLFLGVLIPRKGVADLLKAAKQLNESGTTQYEILVAGSGEEETKLKDYVAQNQLEKNVTFLGWIGSDQKAKLLQKADVLVLPSYNEGLPMAILEAMSYGLPIISTNVGSIAEAVQDEVNGFLFTPGDVEALSAKMKDLITDSTLWRKQSIQSRKIAEDNFAEASFFHKIRDIYLEQGESV